MFEMFIAVTLGIIVGLSAFTVLTVSVALSPKFMKWYTKKIMMYFEELTEINYDYLEKEVKGSL